MSHDKNPNMTEPYPDHPGWEQKFKDGISMSDLTDKLGYSLYDLVKKSKTLRTTDQLLWQDYIMLSMFFIISVAIGVYLGGVENFCSCNSWLQIYL